MYGADGKRPGYNRPELKRSGCLAQSIYRPRPVGRENRTFHSVAPFSQVSRKQKEALPEVRIILQKLVRARKNGQRDKKRTSFDSNAVDKNGAPAKTSISESLNDAFCFSEK
ncbi:MAG: hypothetical protein WB460_19720 [Candidatus Acidiferrales bacterium]